MADFERSYSGTIVAAILLAVMIAGIGYRYWPSDERAIRRHLSNLAEALSFPLTESEEERLTRIAVLREYFAPDVRVIVDDRELTSRDEIINVLARYQPPPGGVNVEFVNVAITLAQDHESATVTLTAKMSLTNDKGVSTVDERAANLTMRNVDNDWVIANAVLRAPTALVQLAGRPKRRPLPSVRRCPFLSRPASQSQRPCRRPQSQSTSRLECSGQLREHRQFAYGESCLAG
jgi:Domain of unknown function (DUF4440)